MIPQCDDVEETEEGKERHEETVITCGWSAVTVRKCPSLKGKQGNCCYLGFLKGEKRANEARTWKLVK